MKKRLIVLGSFAAVAVSSAALGDFLFFTDPLEFYAAIEAKGMVSTGFWDFNPNNVGPDFHDGIDDPLNFKTAPGTGIWDEMPLDGIQFQSNKHDGGGHGPHPSGLNGLSFFTAPSYGVKNNALVASGFFDSFDILSGLPVAANHTAMAFNAVSIEGDGVSPVEVHVWDKNAENETKFIIGPLQYTDEQFVGILAVGPGATSIGRVNIWDSGLGGAEGISFIQVFVPGPGSLALLGLAGLFVRPRRRG